MSAEISQQPDALGALITRRTEILEEVRNVQRADHPGVIFVARGSSDNAALAGRYAVEMTSRRPAALGALSMHNRYGCQSDLAGWLVVGVSQSGATPEVIDYTAFARRGGARTIAVTNGTDNPLADAAHVAISLDTGPEKAVPATKTFTATVAVLLFIAEALGPSPWEDQWDDVPAAVAGCLTDPPSSEMARSLAQSQRILVVARGVLTAAAHETALKLQETTGRTVSAYSSADLYHGPIASYGRETTAIVIGADGPTGPDAVGVAETLGQRGVEVIRVGSADPNSDLATPPRHDALSVITTSVRGQQLALGLARILGSDPDHPEGLAKVTYTV